MMTTTAMVILAAGSSSRMGVPKQNLLYKGQSLLQRAVDISLESVCRPIFVIVGANFYQINSLVDHPCVQILYNPLWNEGMASSIRLAITEIKKDPLIRQVVLTTCDQPFVTSKLIDDMVIKQNKTGRPIVASAYSGTSGIPAIFVIDLFEKLLLLSGQQGAKKILHLYRKHTSLIRFEKGAIDIDTMDDYKKLLKLK